MRIFVAGATGAVGFAFTRLAKEHGHYVHTLSRSPHNERKLAGIADKIDITRLNSIRRGSSTPCATTTTSHNHNRTR